MFDATFTHLAGSAGLNGVPGRVGVRAAGVGAWWWWYYATTEGASMS